MALERNFSKLKPDSAEAGETPRDPERVLGLGNTAIPISFAGLSLTLDGTGAAFAPAFGTLIVSDLHLEKGSGAAARGWLVPSLDSHDTLLRLRCVIEAYRPKRIVCLGDTFHDRHAGQRMASPDRDALRALCALADEWIWISGNHDPVSPAFCEGERLEEIEIGGIVLRHQPAARSVPQIVGHFHPKAGVPAGGRRFSGPCFCAFDDLFIMPAFGAYTGGLTCSDPAIRSLRASEPKMFMLYAAKVWRIS